MQSLCDNTKLFSDVTEIEKEIEACLNKGFPMLFFPKRIEEQFFCDSLSQRKKHFFITTIIALFLYNLFLITDMTMVPDVWKKAWAIRLGIVTPAFLFLILAIRKNWLSNKLEYAVNAVVMITMLSIMIIYDMSNHPNALYYHSGVVLVVMYGNIVVKLRFWHAVFISWVSFIIYVFVINRMHGFDSANIVNSIIVCFTTLVITQVANYQIESEERRNYLRSKLKEIDNIMLSISKNEFERISTIDELTGIANRRLFDTSFEKEWRVAMRYQAPLSLIFIDIDEFKAYNDHYGHKTGDECLKKVAHLIKQSIHRPHDLCARYGGEEFVILLADTCLENAVDIAERIRTELVNEKIEHLNSKVADHVTSSFGVACLIPAISGNQTELIENADKALYLAKASGKNIVKPYTATIGCE